MQQCTVFPYNQTDYQKPLFFLRCPNCPLCFLRKFNQTKRFFTSSNYLRISPSTFHLSRCFDTGHLSPLVEEFSATPCLRGPSPWLPYSSLWKLFHVVLTHISSHELPTSMVIAAPGVDTERSCMLFVTLLMSDDKLQIYHV